MLNQITTAELGLLHTICEQPADDTSRLVYADWLDENGGETQSEFIRADVDWWNFHMDLCEISGLDPQTHRSKNSSTEGKHRRHLLRVCGNDFLVRTCPWTYWARTTCRFDNVLRQLEFFYSVDPPTDVIFTSFRRGLPFSISLTSAQLLSDEGCELFRRYPLEKVELADLSVHATPAVNRVYLERHRLASGEDRSHRVGGIMIPEPLWKWLTKTAWRSGDIRDIHYLRGS